MRYCMTLYLKGHWNYERSKLELLNLLNKNALFWNFQVLSLVFPMPLEIQSHTVPHLKALISGNLEPRGLRWGSTFRVCQALFKSAVLLHKEAYRADLFSSECTYKMRILFVTISPGFWSVKKKMVVPLVLNSEPIVNSVVSLWRWPYWIGNLGETS